ncbi:MAG TPA: hypothetical protein VF532_03365 [Candidatus Angelobacter sp.]
MDAEGRKVLAIGNSMLRPKNALLISMVMSALVAAVGGIFAYQGSAFGNILWPGLVVTVSTGLVNVHAAGNDVSFSMVAWSAILSFIIYSGLLYVGLRLLFGGDRTA